MPGRYLVAALAAALLGLTLAACSGGGGGSPTAPTAQTPAEAALAADPGKTLQAAQRGADALPRFGSVTQSTNAGTDGVTTDRARAMVDGAGATVTVTRSGQSPLTIDTANAVDSRKIDGEVGHSIPGAARTYRSWTIQDIAERGATYAIIVTTSVDDDPGDWLARGYWLHIAGENLVSSAPNVTHAEMGAFVDGPELRSPPEQLPTDMTARYEGSARGYYASRYGTAAARVAGVAPGSPETGRFAATATLTANFDGAGNTISGCIGCKGSFYLFDDISDGAGADPTSTDYQVRLGAAQIGSDGTFRAEDVTVYSATLQAAGFGIESQSGSWGGKLSNIPVATGEPRLAAGTFGGRATYSDGTTSAYVGAFDTSRQ